MKFTYLWDTPFSPPPLPRHVELLLQKGSNLRKERTEEGCTAAHYAARSGPVEVSRSQESPGGGEQEPGVSW